MDRNDFTEKVIGGVLGAIAIVAAVMEMILGGFTAESIVAAVKDIAGTLVVVVLLVAFVKSLPKKPKNLSEILEKSVEDWGFDNAPLIFKTEGYVAAQNSAYTQGFVLLQNPKNYIALANQKLNRDNPEWKKYAQYGSGKLTGKFLDLPDYHTMISADFDMMIVMEQSHFQNMPEIDAIVDDIVAAIHAWGKSAVHAERIGKAKKIRLSFRKIVSVQDVDFLVDMLDFALSLVKVIV